MFSCSNGSQKVEIMPFTIITDHASLKWLMTLKDLNGRLARWSLQLQIYDFQIEHKKGSENIVADMLSRVPQQFVEEIKECDLLDFETNEFESDEYVELVKEITENSSRLPDLKVVEGKVFKRSLNDQRIDDPYQWNR